MKKNKTWLSGVEKVGEGEKGSEMSIKGKRQSMK